MYRINKNNLLLITMFLVSLCLYSFASAAPAYSEFQTLKQPTGETFSAVSVKYSIPITSIGPITGKPLVSSCLTAGAVTPQGHVQYQWQSSDALSGPYIDIPGATTNSFYPQNNVMGKYVRVTAKGIWEYTGMVISTAIGPIKCEINRVDATGSGYVGSSLRILYIAPEEATVTYQWMRAGEDLIFYDIPGATENTYTLSLDDLGKYFKVKMNGIGNYVGEVMSSNIGPGKIIRPTSISCSIIPLQVNNVISVATVGTTPSLQGQVVPVTYQWMRADSENGTYLDIPGAIERSYKFTTADEGKFFKVEVTGTDIVYGTLTSSAYGPVLTKLTGISPILGNAKVGSDLTAGEISPAGATVTYRWYRSSSATRSSYELITGQSNNTYTLCAADAGKYIWVVAEGTGAYWSVAGSQSIGPVQYPTNTAGVTIESLNPNPLVPSLGRQVIWTCNASGGTALQYQFSINSNETGWQVVQEYSASNTYSHTPTVPGEYQMRVYVRDVSSSSDYDASYIFPYTIKEPVSIISLTSDKVSPQACDTTITWTCNTISGVLPQYKFFVNMNETGWQEVCEYSYSKSYSWKPLSPGEYQIRVWVRDSGSTNDYDAELFSAKYTIYAPITSLGPISGAPALGATLTAGTISPSGATVTYQWQRAYGSPDPDIYNTYENIPGATNNTYTATDDDFDMFIRVVITGTGNYSGTVASTRFGPVLYR